MSRHHITSGMEPGFWIGFGWAALAEVAIFAFGLFLWWLVGC